MKESS